MKTQAFSSVLMSLLLVVSLGGVYAAGSSTGGSSSSSVSSSSDFVTSRIGNGTNTSIEKTVDIVARCEEPGDRKARILCRIQNNIEDEDFPADSVPEACRNLGFENREQCRGFYRNSQECYEIRDGRSKDACFRRVAGFSQASLGGADKTAIRNYAVALLYELQERIENLNEAGEVSDESASDLISLIVDAKEKILDQNSRENVRQSIQALKTRWREIFGMISDEPNRDANEQEEDGSAENSAGGSGAGDSEDNALDGEEESRDQTGL